MAQCDTSRFGKMEVDTLMQSAIFKTATVVCNYPDIKREIFCISESNYIRWLEKNSFSKDDARKKMWSKIIETESSFVLQKIFGLPKHLIESIIDIIKIIGMRMLFWAKFNLHHFNIERTVSYNCFDCSLFTSKGTINTKKAAEKLIRSCPINSLQCYKLSCYYFLTRINSEKKVEFLASSHFEKELTCLLTGQNQSGYLDYAFKTAVESGNEVVVRCCWDKFSPEERERLVVNYAIKILNKLKFIPNTINDCSTTFYDFSIWDGVYKLDRNYFSSFCMTAGAAHNVSSMESLFPHHLSEKVTGIPRIYYADTFCFLFSNMKNDQKIEVFKKHPEMLAIFLDWPYEKYLIETIELVWNYITKLFFSHLLITLVKRIHEYCVELNFSDVVKENYRRLLMEIWRRSPDPFKKFALICDYGNSNTSHLIAVLFKCSNNMSLYDAENIPVFFADLTEKEIRQICFSKLGKTICSNLIINRKFQMVEFFMKAVGLLKLEEKIVFQFKKYLMCFELIIDYCCGLIIYGQHLDLVMENIKWCSSTEIFCQNYKKLLANRNDCFIFKKLICNQDWDIIEKVLTWFFSSENEILRFKEGLRIKAGAEIHLNLILLDQWEKAETYFAWLNLSVEDIKKLKRESIFNHVNRYNLPNICFGENLIVRWCLSDKEQVQQFQTHCYNKFVNEFHDLQFKISYANFNLGLVQILTEIDKELKDSSSSN